MPIGSAQSWRCSFSVGGGACSARTPNKWTKARELVGEGGVAGRLLDSSRALA